MRRRFAARPCHFVYYFNPTVASAAILLRSDGCGLFIRRAKEPSKGMLGLVGGFIDIGETAEEGLRREVREEVGLELEGVFLPLHPTQQLSLPGRDVSRVGPLFIARVQDPEKAVALDDVESFCWMDPHAVRAEEMAFPSMRKALLLYQSI
jgi:ADP-ribose pyrophosphatase YjhB (NUDIX family)